MLNLYLTRKNPFEVSSLFFQGIKLQKTDTSNTQDKRYKQKTLVKLPFTTKFTVTWNFICDTEVFDFPLQTPCKKFPTDNLSRSMIQITQRECRTPNYDFLCSSFTSVFTLYCTWSLTGLSESDSPQVVHDRAWPSAH